MKRIFLTLAALSTLLLTATFVLGLSIGDPTERERAVEASVQYHINLAVGALVFAALVHALVLTYFMGTGRWMEETGQAYRLPDQWRNENQSLKYRTIPAMVGCLVLLILNVPLGATADPASPIGFEGWAGLSASMLHLLIAIATLGGNIVVNVWEYTAIHRNGELVNEVLREVRRLREERGLPV